jgi:lipopolysaccharide transport system permease protein
MPPTSTTPPEETYFFDADKKNNTILGRFKELLSYHYLLYNLTMRDVKLRYKGSFLGVLWSMLNPLGTMLVFTLLFTVLSGNNNSAPNRYPIFILVGLIPWNFFVGSMLSGTTTVVGHASLIKKVYFPRELLFLSSLLSNLVNFAIAGGVFLVIFYLSGLRLNQNALWVPIILLIQMIFTLGICFFLGSINVFYRDVMMILDVVVLAWFFMTPVFYPFSQFGDTATLWGITFSPAQLMRWINPMASIIDGYRTVLWGVDGTGGVAMDPSYMLRTFATSMIVLIIGYIVFWRTEHLFGEKL